MAQTAGSIAMSIKQCNDAYFRAKEHRKYDKDSTRTGKKGTIHGTYCVLHEKKGGCVNLLQKIPGREAN